MSRSSTAAGAPGLPGGPFRRTRPWLKAAGEWRAEGSSLDARKLFQEDLPALKDGTLYPREIAYHQGIYGEEAMAKNWWLFVTTDGCHPNKAGTNIIADALQAAIEQALTRK